MHILSLLLFTVFSVSAQTHLSIKTIDAHTKQATVQIELMPGDKLYKDYLTLSVDNPHVTLASWETHNEPINYFDSSFKENKKVYTNSVTIVCDLKTDVNEPQMSNLHLCYYLASQKKIVEEVVPLIASQNQLQEASETAFSIDIPETQDVSATPINQPETKPSTPKKSLLERITAMATEGDSWTFRLLGILLLGLLMSLTPCIYPMIPITAGILQAQGCSSLLMNFLLSASYTTGIATTFAILGLLAAFAGQAMGSLMTNPLFILPLVALLVYLALSMIGLYDMYIPKFFQPRDHKVTGGSFISAFVFGMISGIVASPCLSPGLLCLLCIVTTIGSKLLGFIMLFVFGIGLGIPLLIIGTFSGSLNLLPRAGMWMVEIKKLFGYVMLAMCLYFISYIVNVSAMLFIITLFCIVIGIIFLTYSRTAHSKAWRMVYTILGVALIAGSVVSAFKTYQSLTTSNKSSEYHWPTDYGAAKEEALKQNKKLFVDVGAPFCSICKAIDATLFSDAQVIAALEERMVPVKVDGSDARNAELMKQYQIFGFPTILCVDPASETVLKKWGPELYGTKPEAFLQEIELIN